MTRRLLLPGQIDFATWARVAHTELPSADRRIYQRRQRAIELYVASEPIAAIERRTQVDRFTLYRLLKRCLALHPDGRLQGFRALVPRYRVRNYRRQSAPQLTSRTGHRGLVGAFTFLLAERPQLRAWIDQAISRRYGLLDADSARATVRLRGIGELHEQFIAQCRAAGLTRSDYPLNTRHGALRTFSGFVRQLLQERFSTMARLAGATHLKGLPVEPSFPAPPARAPFEIVEMDAHRFDARLKIVEIDPLGVPTEYEINRVWLLVILDVFTRCVLGYQVVCSPEVSRFDVIRTIELALQPHAPRQFSHPLLQYSPKSGFPSMVLPELGYACWQWLRLDNARANLAEDTLTTLSQFVGCHIDAGPPYQPDARPFIERFFGTLEQHLGHRLPGTTGSKPGDLRQRLTNTKGALRLLLTLDELEDAMEVAIADYNGAPHGSLGGRSPLEMMQACVRGQGFTPRVLPEPHRRTLCLLQRARVCRVRAYVSSGHRPHISLFGVSHTSLTLANSAALIGQPLLIYYNPGDLRVVQAFLTDGTEFGELRAQGEWGKTRHTLKLRQEILRLKRRKQLRYLENSSVFEAYIEYHRVRAGKSRRHASAVASMRKLQREQRAAPPPPPAVPSPDPAALTGQPAAPRKRVVARRLKIGTGHSYRKAL